jgi:hypothetical protein
MKLPITDLESNIVATGYFPEWYRTKRPTKLRPFSDLLISPCDWQSFSIYTPKFFPMVAAGTRNSEGGETWREICP